jgi:hypothetical protein
MRIGSVYILVGLLVAVGLTSCVPPIGSGDPSDNPVEYRTISELLAALPAGEIPLPRAMGGDGIEGPLGSILARSITPAASRLSGQRIHSWYIARDGGLYFNHVLLGFQKIQEYAAAHPDLAAGDTFSLNATRLDDLLVRADKEHTVDAPMGNFTIEGTLEDLTVYGVIYFDDTNGFETQPAYITMNISGEGQKQVMLYVDYFDYTNDLQYSVSMEYNMQTSEGLMVMGLKHIPTGTVFQGTLSEQTIYDDQIGFIRLYDMHNDSSLPMAIYGDDTYVVNAKANESETIGWYTSIDIFNGEGAVIDSRTGSENPGSDWDMASHASYINLADYYDSAPASISAGPGDTEFLDQDDNPVSIDAINIHPTEFDVDYTGGFRYSPGGGNSAGDFIYRYNDTDRTFDRIFTVGSTESVFGRQLYFHEAIPSYQLELAAPYTTTHTVLHADDMSSTFLEEIATGTPTTIPYFDHPAYPSYDVVTYDYQPYPVALLPMMGPVIPEFTQPDVSYLNGIMNKLNSIHTKYWADFMALDFSSMILVQDTGASIFDALE